MKKQQSFEDKIQKLDELLKEMEEVDISLTKSVELYKTGSNLVKEAREILENAKLEIKIIGEDNG